ncbi:MAG: hypothetical protein WD749_11300 [Phycisphaerales bacterium]
MSARGAIRRAVAALATVAAAGACLVVAAWLFTRLVSDRLAALQVAAWVPSLAFLGAGAALLAGAGLLAWLHGRGATGGTPVPLQRGRVRPARGLRRVALAGLAVVGAYAAWSELRLWNAVWPPAPAPPGKGIRLVNWNLNIMGDEAAIGRAVGSQSPGVAVLVNGSMRLRWAEVVGSLGLPHRAGPLNMMVVASRWPVLRYGGCHLGVPPPDESRGVHRDPGRAMYVELDTTGPLGRPIVVWVIDLPSDERLGRWAVAGRARAVIESWRGPELRADGAGGFAPGPFPGAFPAPDVIVGDFNIPRGSASLSLLTTVGGTGALPNAFDAAGWGYCATYPRERPLVHIDQAFAGRGVRATAYETVDLGMGRHRAQVVDLAPAR